MVPAVSAPTAATWYSANKGVARTLNQSAHSGTCSRSEPLACLLTGGRASREHTRHWPFHCFISNVTCSVCQPVFSYEEELHSRKTQSKSALKIQVLSFLVHRTWPLWGEGVGESPNSLRTMQQYQGHKRCHTPSPPGCK